MMYFPVIYSNLGLSVGRALCTLKSSWDLTKDHLQTVK